MIDLYGREYDVRTQSRAARTPELKPGCVFTQTDPSAHGYLVRYELTTRHVASNAAVLLDGCSRLCDNLHSSIVKPLLG